MKSLGNDLYALEAEKSERSRRQHKSPGRSSYANRTWSKDNSRDSCRVSQDRDRRATRRSDRSRNKSRKNSGDRLDNRTRNSRNEFKQKSNKHCIYCDQDGHTLKYCWEMQANVKKVKRLKEIDDSDDDSSDTFNYMVTEDSISDDDLN